MRQSWVVFAMLCGCRFDPSLLAGANIACAADGACPQDLVCQVTLGRCVSPARLDQVPPAVANSDTTYVPRPGNRLVQPTALGPLTQAVVSFGVTEALGSLPVLRAEVNGADEPRVSCALSAITPPTYQATCGTAAVVSGADAQLVWRVQLVDAVGNRADVQLASVGRLDVTPPPPPDTADGGAWLRDSPWGDALTGFVARAELQAHDGVVHDAVRVAFRQDLLGLGEVDVTDGGGWPSVTVVATSTGTRPEVAAIDGAGNESTWKTIDEVHWVATLGGKIAGQTYPNPHRVQVVRGETDGLEGFPVTERGALDGLDRPGGAQLRVEGAATWRRTTFQPPRGPTGFPSGAYDPDRSRVVRFGGISGSDGDYPRTTSEWSGIDWQVRPASDPEGDGEPEGRLAGQMVWDPRHRGVLLHGGFSSVLLSDTWLWNGYSWKRLPDAPVGRFGHLLYFDSALGTVVTTGGLGAAADGGTALLMDAWRLDDGQWRPTSPPAFLPRAAASIATEPLTGLNVMFGGDALDTRLWFERDGVWAPQTPGVSGPVARTQAAATWDPRIGRFMLSGGVTAGGTTLDETWAFDLRAQGWERLAWDGGLSPGARAGHVLVADPARNRVVLFGQLSDGGVVQPADNDTWALAGDRWTLSNRPAPPARGGHVG